MKRLLVAFTILLILSTACQEVEISSGPVDFPYDYIHPEFRYSSFSYPDDWDVVSIYSNVEHRFQDWEEPENHRYSEVPYRYSFTFGKEAEDNDASEDDIEIFNEKQELKGETYRQLYYHTFYEHYAVLQISENGFFKLVSEMEEAEEWKINGEKFMVVGKGHEWIVNWYSDGVYYDLVIRGEAEITSKEKCQEFLKLMFLS